MAIKHQDNNNKSLTARLLDDEPVGMTVQVVRVLGDGAFRQRLLEIKIPQFFVPDVRRRACIRAHVHP